MKIIGTFNSVWDGGYVISTSCTIDLDTGIVEPDVASEEESESVDILDREYVEFSDEEFDLECDQESNDYRVSDLQKLWMIATDCVPVKTKDTLWKHVESAENNKGSHPGNRPR